jgi:Tfp pilus assembly protein FimT
LYKKTFSLIELIFVIVLISIILSQLIPKNNFSQLQLATNKLILYLKYTRYIAFLDDKFDINNNKWFRQRWTLKFQKCKKSIGGLYYLIYSDKNQGGHVNKDECLKDPITKRYLYSGYNCIAKANESKYVLLTKEFGIIKVDVSCNKTNTIGKISFSNDGNIYAKLSTNADDAYKFKIKNICYINLYDKKNNKSTIAIEPKTGYIFKL